MAGLVRRGAAALAVLVLPAGLAVGAVWVAPWPPAEQPSLTVPVASPAVDLVCPSPVRLATPGTGESGNFVDPEFDPTPVAPVSRLTALTTGTSTTPVAAQVRSLDASEVLDELPGSGLASIASARGPDQATVVHVDGGQDRPVEVAGSLVTLTTGGDLRSLVAASCGPATAESWLVGGSTEVESSARLVLQNPGRTPATITVDVWGATGAVDLAAAPELLVPAGQERSVLLEGLAIDQSRVVVRVASTGGVVSAYLQDSALDGLSPAGVSSVVAGSSPALRQVVPAVSLTGREDEPAILRLLAPGDQGGTVRVSVLGATGTTALPGAESIDIDPGEVLDVPLAGLEAGVDTLVVDADVPVVAGAMVARSTPVAQSSSGLSVPVDRSWSASVVPGLGGVIALPQVAGWSLALSVPEADTATAAQVSIEVIDLAGNVMETTTTLVQPGRSVTLDGADLVDSPADAAAVVVRAEDDVAWSALLEVPRDDGDLIAVLAPVSLPVPRESVDVALR